MNSIKKFLKQFVSLRDLNAWANSFRVPGRLIEVQLQLQQRALAASWISLRLQGAAPHLDEVGFRCHSQFEEDGLLLYIFSVIGSGRRTAVEMCAGNGRECMAANLIVHHGWDGVLFDGDPVNVRHGQRFFGTNQFTFAQPPRFLHAWITRENVNELIAATGTTGEVDLFSLDIDGNDYWVWEALSVIQPRVCILETHNVIPSDLALSMPYQPGFSFWDLPENIRDFRGASLKAFAKLGARKGYRLVGANRLGFNAIFIREDLGRDVFPEVSVESCHDNPYSRIAQSRRWPLVRNQGWTSV